MKHRIKSLEMTSLERATNDVCANLHKLLDEALEEKDVYAIIYLHDLIRKVERIPRDLERRLFY